MTSVVAARVVPFDRGERVRLWYGDRLYLLLENRFDLQLAIEAASQDELPALHALNVENEDEIAYVQSQFDWQGRACV